MSSLVLSSPLYPPCLPLQLLPSQGEVLTPQLWGLGPTQAGCLPLHPAHVQKKPESPKLPEKSAMCTKTFYPQPLTRAGDNHGQARGSKSEHQALESSLGVCCGVWTRLPIPWSSIPLLVARLLEGWVQDAPPQPF